MKPTSIIDNYESRITIFVFTLISLIFLSCAFYYSPIMTGDDWQTFYDTLGRVIIGENLFIESTSFAYYSNPPWLALLLLPLRIVPYRWGWSILSALSLVSVVVISYKLKIGKIKFIALVLSPPFIYTVLHGQVDAIIMLGVLLPPKWWGVVALTKPQTVGGLIIQSLRRENIFKGFIILFIFLVITILLFGIWPLDLINQPKPFVSDHHNIWYGLWPFQVVVGIVLLLHSISTKKFLYQLAASPFMMPYATIGNLYGLWLSMCILLPEWHTVVVVITWWCAVVYRLLI